MKQKYNLKDVFIHICIYYNFYITFLHTIFLHLRSF